jgi:hypothetical protein
MVAVNNVVVPVALALFQCSALEFEAANPSAGLLGVLGKWKLSRVVVPGAEEMHRFAVGGRAESEVELNGCHFPFFFLCVQELTIMNIVVVLFPFSESELAVV